MYLYRVPRGTTSIYRSEAEILALPDEEKIYSFQQADPDPEKTAFNGTPLVPRREYYHAPGVEEVAYWRKANAIHAWFVNECGGGIDECQMIPVHPEQIVDLYSRCRQVIEARGTPEAQSVAMTLLPPQAGFFFGGREVDEWYYKDLEETMKTIDQLAQTAKPGTELIYQASW